MKNFPFEHEGQTLWYSRSCCTLAFVFGLDKNYNLMILANKRGPGCPDEVGKWCLPCGYIDFDETAEEACCREIHEETGVDIYPSQLELLNIHSEPEGRQNITIRYLAFCEQHTEDYTLYWTDSEVNEVEDAKWINADEIDQYDWAFNHLELLHQIIPEIRSVSDTSDMPFEV